MVGNNIKKYRRKLNITQEDLAKELNVTKQYVSKLELGRTTPGIDICFNVLKAMINITRKKSNGKQIIGLKLDDLFYDDEL